HRTEHRPQQLQIGAGARTVAIPAREQDFPGPQASTLPRPLYGVGWAGLATAVRKRFPPVAGAARIDGEDDALAAELGGELGEEKGALKSGRVHAHLVRTGREQPARVFHAPDAAADRERN